MSSVAQNQRSIPNVVSFAPWKKLEFDGCCKKQIINSVNPAIHTFYFPSSKTSFNVFKTANFVFEIAASIENVQTDYNNKMRVQLDSGGGTNYEFTLDQGVYDLNRLKAKLNTQSQAFIGGWNMIDFDGPYIVLKAPAGDKICLYTQLGYPYWLHHLLGFTWQDDIYGNPSVAEMTGRQIYVGGGGMNKVVIFMKGFNNGGRFVTQFENYPDDFKACEVIDMHFFEYALTSYIADVRDTSTPIPGCDQIPFEEFDGNGKIVLGIYTLGSPFDTNNENGMMRQLVHWLPTKMTTNWYYALEVAKI
jgi:hypothetical protein